MQQLGSPQTGQSCSPCVDGMATRAPFRAEEQNRYALTDALFSDTTGPISPLDADGNRYVQIMVDACIGWTDIQMMWKKNEATRAIIKSLSKIQVLCDKNTRRLHTDEAREEDTAKLNDYLATNEIQSAKTAPSTFQANAFAERRFRQLVDANRTAIWPAI
eukprot:Plantae.Rhodophyta-Palmaria_palmata.ctg2444.p1 GENE.Plantae.Rhodophyta-Palmaria_palmata.ctg2444~~Plantae.Rhodophyta-Palmaria_palmata.ctg2444.p1  ORF type:complete len:161 (+),score=3.84 Plantae.Rhodophyta-Palmaria_palmata.ctg2444:315-797(+)